jgi:hypothetical protein
MDGPPGGGKGTGSIGSTSGRSQLRRRCVHRGNWHVNRTDWRAGSLPVTFLSPRLDEITRDLGGFHAPRRPCGLSR